MHAGPISSIRVTDQLRLLVGIDDFDEIECELTICLASMEMDAAPIWQDEIALTRAEPYVVS